MENTTSMGAKGAPAVPARVAGPPRGVAIALTKALLFVLHFTVFGAVAVVARLLGRDLLRPDRPEPGSYWLPRAPMLHTVKRSRRQI